MEHDLEGICRDHWRVAGLDQFEPPAVKDLEPLLSRLELYIRDVPAIRHVDFRRFCSEMLNFHNVRQIRSIVLADFTLGGTSVELKEPSTEDLKGLVDLLFPYSQGGDYAALERDDVRDRITFWFYGLSIIQGEGWDKLTVFLRERFRFSAWIIVDVDMLSLKEMF
jgi:hypothetical protein